MRSLSWGVAEAARPGDGLGTAQLVLGLGVRPERAHRDAGHGAPAAWHPEPFTCINSECIANDKAAHCSPRPKSVKRQFSTFSVKILPKPGRAGKRLH